MHKCDLLFLVLERWQVQYNLVYLDLTFSDISIIWTQSQIPKSPISSVYSPQLSGFSQLARHKPKILKMSA